MYTKFNSEYSVLLANNTYMNQNLNDSLDKLSSGTQINKVSDDSSGLAIADKLRSTSNVLSQGLVNVNNGISLLQIADKAITEMSNILDIIKIKAVQMVNDTLTDNERETIKNEIIKLIENYDHIVCTTKYNETYPLQYDDNPLVFQTGEYLEDKVEVSLNNAITSCNLGQGQPYNLYDFINGFQGFSSSNSINILDLPQNSETIIDTSGLSGVIEIVDADENSIQIDLGGQVNDIETYTGVNGTVTFNKLTNELTVVSKSAMQVQPSGVATYDYLDSFPTNSSLQDNITTEVLDIQPTVDRFDVSFNNFTNSGTGDILEVQNGSGATVLLINDTGIVTNTDPNITVNMLGEQIDISFINVSDTYKVYATDDIKNSSTVINDVVNNAPLYNLTQDPSATNRLKLINGQVDTAIQDGIETDLFIVPQESDSSSIDLSTMSGTDQLIIRDSGGNQIVTYINSTLNVIDPTVANFTMNGTSLEITPLVGATIGADLDVNIIPDDASRVSIESGVIQSDFNWAQFNQGNGLYSINDFSNVANNNGDTRLNLSTGTPLAAGMNLFTNLPTDIQSITFNTDSFGTVDSETLQLRDLVGTLLGEIRGTSADSNDSTSTGNSLPSDNNGTAFTEVVNPVTTATFSTAGNDNITFSNLQQPLQVFMGGGAALYVDSIDIQIPNGMQLGALNIQADVHIPTITHQPLDMTITNHTLDTSGELNIISQENCIVCPVGYFNTNSTDLKEQASTLLGVIDDGLTQLNIERGNIGGGTNRLESISKTIMSHNVHTQVAESMIRDVDYALESSRFNQFNILSKAGNFRMSQISNLHFDLISSLFK